MRKTDTLHDAVGILCAVGIALLAIFYCIAGREFAEWADAVDYQATAQCIVSSMSFMPMPLGYEEFLAHGAGAFGSSTVNYPNYGFELLIALLSFLRQDFSLLNGSIVSAVVSVLLSLTLYALALRLSSSKIMACLFSLVILFHHTIIGLTASPLTDIGLLLFFTLAVWAMLEDKVLLAGVVLGVGYIFREHALMFAPFLPLLSPRVTSLKSYFRAGLVFALGFLPALLVTNGIETLLTVGEKQQNFYSSNHYPAFSWFSWHFAYRFLANLGTYTRFLHVVVLGAALVILIRFRRSPLPSLKLIGIGLIITAIPCFLWAQQGNIQPRYLIYSVFIFFLAILLALQHHPRKVQYFALIVLGCFIVRFPSAVNLRSLSAFLQPQQTMERFVGTVMEPMLLRDHYPQQATILANIYPFAYLVVKDSIAVKLPEYEVFLQSRGNDKFDGIIIRQGENAGWPNLPVITDTAGVSFEKIPTHGKELTKQTRFYKRITSSVGGPQ